MPRVTFLTDFGTRDGYVAAMKGVVGSLVPGAFLDDVSHDVAPGDVAGAARALARYWDRYPDGTVHLVVVDPGVGTHRRALALSVDGRFVVAPDNGIVSRVLDGARSWTAVEASSLDHLPRFRSRTFHGRDVFAPAAAHLARGGSLEALGPAVGDPVRIPEPTPVVGVDEAIGEVVHVDRFGNLSTNLPGELARGTPAVELGGRIVPTGQTYGDVRPGEAVALENSDGRLEIAIRDGSAAKGLRAGLGTPVRIPRASGTES